MPLINIPTGQVCFYYTSDGRTRTLPAIINREQIHGYSRLLIQFGFNARLKDEVKAMEGARWLGFDEERPRKAWVVSDTPRNHFQLAYLMGMNPYAPYDTPLVEYNSGRTNPPLYKHQVETVAFSLTRRHCIIAEEMGCGKSLSAIEALEYAIKVLKFRPEECMWVGPRSALDSVKYEFVKWQAGTVPLFFTYETIRSFIDKIDQIILPRVLVCDEASRLKTPTAQRTQAIQIITDKMRHLYGHESLIILMTGTPAPKDPSDWWSLCEIACPGFLKEGNLVKFKNRLALIKQYESSTGGSFPKLVTWWDDENKCKVCGKLQDDPDHDHINMVEKWYHPFTKSVNEVAYLYERLKGLVLVKFKKDLLDLPEKVFKIIKCKPTASVLRASNLITKTARSAIKALTLNRELSDGFQYQEVPDGEETCPTCEGRLIIKMNVDLDDPTNPLDGESLACGHRAIWDEEKNIITGYKSEPLKIGEKEIDCPQCGKKGTVTHYSRIATRVDCPKDQVIADLLDQYSDEGRFIIWAAFSDSVDRNVENCIKNGWSVIRLDGRNWWASSDIMAKMEVVITKEFGMRMLQLFDNKTDFPKVAFVGNPGAGGFGLNLTASSVEVFYSNSFKAEDRAQAIDRIHRPGADHNRGCMIIDLIHLPQDEGVLQSHERKIDLMHMSMGMLQTVMQKVEEEYERAI